MVEIKKYNKITKLIVAMGLTIATINTPTMAQTEPSNMDYAELKERSTTLTHRIDSLTKVVAQRRSNLAAGGSNSADLMAEIVSIEQKLFDYQLENNATITKLANMGINVIAESNGGDKLIRTSAKQISSSDLVKQNIPSKDIDNLKAAESHESLCAKMFESYQANYTQLRELQAKYDQAIDEAEAKTYSNEFKPLARSNDSLAMVMAEEWRKIYDSKGYAYAMVLEILDDDKLLAEEQKINHKAAVSIASVECGDKERAIVEYDYQKRGLVQLELLLAKGMNMPQCADSLNVISAKLAKRSYIMNLDDVILVKRNFILYEPITIESTTYYNRASNPIPEATKYESGTVYRIQLGAYKYEQQPSIFRGAVPISYDKNIGLWTYYVGSFERLAEAEAALEECKQHGFRRPEIVRWCDGERRNLAREPLPDNEKFRVQITGNEKLSDSVMETLKVGGDIEITRIAADKYIAGTITNRIKAEELVEALQECDDTITVNLIELENNE